MRLFRKLSRKLGYLEKDQLKQIHAAYLIAEKAHKGQMRSSGDPYITHPVAVTGILADMHMDYESLMAALLHDVIEDTALTKEDLSQKFGESVAELVDGVSKLTQIEFQSRAEQQAENFRKMVLAMAKDIRVILVKLADRLHNMRTVSCLPTEKRHRIAKETLDIFAPIAKRLGMHDLSIEMQDLSFEALYPDRFRVLKSALQRVRGNQKQMVRNITSTLKDGLKKNNIKNAEAFGREKHLYSIYQKMREKNLSFSELSDIYAFRIVVEKKEDCYHALGIVHSLYKPVPERFKDYIAIPKSNGYQSLHTTLFSPFGNPIEVQIRSVEMHHLANSGIASHWLYKSGETHFNKSQIRAQQWVRNLLELQQSIGNSLEFIENVKIDLFPDDVYVFTPQGGIMELPAGATIIDFAYAVHSEVGNTCVAARVDRQLMPLSTALTNGQTVEIITTAHARPSPSWLNFVTTGKARSNIRNHIKNQRRSESIKLGKQLLNNTLATHHTTLDDIDTKNIQTMLSEIELASMEDVLEQIALGQRIATLVAHRLLKQGIPAEEERAETLEPLVIRGTEGMAVQFASCCSPIPGDPIVGLLETGKGLTIHTEHCSKIIKLCHKGETSQPVQWADNLHGEFPVLLEATVINERGALALLAQTISNADANIEDIRVLDRDTDHYRVRLTVVVSDRTHLAQVLRSIRYIDSITSIHRFKKDVE